MNSIKIPTAQTPSFGMPVRDAASASACLGTVATARLRHRDGIVVGDVRVPVMAAQGAFPGTTVWRPPSC